VLFKPLVLIVQLILEWLRKRKRGDASAPLPAETVRVVPLDDQHYTWNWAFKPAAAGQVRIMSARGHFHLTAIDPGVTVGIIRTYLVIWYWDRWRFRRVKAGGDAMVSDGRGYEGIWSRTYTIPSGGTREVSGYWLIDPSIRQEGDARPLRARPYFVDQLDNPHSSRRKITFQFVA